MDNSEFLQWLADRLVYVYGESINADFVQRTLNIAKQLEPPMTTEFIKVKKGLWKKGNHFYRMRRGELVKIPDEWLGKVTHPQTQRKRNSRDNGHNKTRKGSGKRR